MVDVSLHYGDCLEIIPKLDMNRIDALVTDPPYGIRFKSNGQWFKGASSIAGDKNINVAMRVVELAKGLPLVMFYSPYKPLPVKWRSVLVWNKGKHVGIGGDRETCWMRDIEMVGVKDNKPLNGKRDSAILAYRALLPPPTGHFAEKPLDLMIYLIEKVSQLGDTILDPFMGSGTTGVACVQTRRNFIGIELESKWFEIARSRIEEANHG